MKLSKILTLLFTCALVASCGKTGGKGGSQEEIYEGTDPSTILNGYYKDLESWDNYLDLRQKLYNIIYKDFVAISYEEDPYIHGAANWTVNRMADQSLYNYDKVNLLYSDNDEFKMKGESSTNWQREHCFPASLMTGLSTGEATKHIGTATDFHNLYASYSSGNSVHSNDCYGDVDPEYGEIKTVGNARYQEAYSSGNIKHTATFEPADFDKGRVARAVFYIGLMYGSDRWVHDVDNGGHELSTGIDIVTRASGVSCSLGSSLRGVKCHSNLEEILVWCQKFWPDRLELQHNNVVQSFQHNRNPFIDFPELVEYVYGSKQMESGELKNLHNIYDILDLGNDSDANIAVENVKYSYDAGDTFSSANDLTVYAVKNDLRKQTITNYVVNGVQDGQPLSDTQNGSTVTISIPNAKSSSYRISVASGVWKEVNYVGLPTYSQVKFSKDSATQEIKPAYVNLNNVNWVINGGSATSTSILDNNGQDVGVIIGSNSTPGGTVTIETLNPMAFDNKQIVKGIYIEANSNSSWNGTFTLKIYLDDEEVYSNTSCRHSSKSKLQTYGVELSSLMANAGKIKYEFSNVQVGLCVGRIGVLVADTY